uniref:Uncharacterized protein n=1 Tax=Oryza sativa subsp. japonica TaxID=39947 RepID=Q6F352_ORYSJ|nr:hypothetical protein [Oryza sativa Japonica Group]
MAPRKPNPASAKGLDPGRVDDDSTAFLGVSLVDDVELAKLVSSGALVAGQAFAPGKAVVPKPIDNRTVVFAAFFEVGLRFPCNVLLPEILRLFQRRALRRHIHRHRELEDGDYPGWNEEDGVRPERSDLWPVNAAMSRWFYHTIPFAAGSDSAKALRCRRRAIAPNRKPKIAVDGAMEARFVLLCKSWQVTIEQWEEADGLPNLVLPEGTNTAGRANRVYNGELPPWANPQKADDDAGPSRKRMRGQVKLAPRKRRVPASSDSDADDEDDAEERDGKEEGEEEEEVEAVADKAANEATEDRVDTPGYTPTPSPDHNETGVESNSSPLRRKDLEGAKALVAFSSGKAAKGGLVKKILKKKGFLDIARVFSDDESSDETPTSPAGRSLDLSAAPLAPLGVAGAGGSAAAGASASAERILSAAARVFGSPVREPAISPLAKAKGKCAAAEAFASEYSLAAPHFAPGDFETRPDLIPFVEGILAAHCSKERTVRARFDGFKSRLRAKDDEISRKNLEVESLVRTLKKAKTEVKRLQSELDKGKEAWAEVDRLTAELEKEKAHSAPKMESLRQKASRAEASAAEESQRFSQEMAKTTESARTACQTLRLALTDMGAKVRGVPIEDASAFDFSEWTQQAGGLVSDCATAYGAIAVHQFGCEHVAEFPTYAKWDWEISAQNISPALRAWRKQFWQKDGRSAAKARLLEQLAKAEAADQGEGEDAVGEEGVRRKSFIRPPFGSWRSQNEKFVAVKGLPKVRCPFRPVYREMEINGRSYKVFKVANWLRAHPGRTLEDYDLVHSKRLEDMARFWRNHQKTNRQGTNFQRRYSLVCVAPPTPLKVVYDISSDDEPSSPYHSLERDSDYGDEDVIYL